MTKQDLRPGMIIELRNGELYMIYELDGVLVAANDYSWLSLIDYDDNLNLNLNLKNGQQDYGIVKIRKPNLANMFIPKYWDIAPIIWERKEPTQKEKYLLMALDDELKWIAKDKDGEVCAFVRKPEKILSEDVWSDDYEIFSLSDFLFYLEFNFLSWDDDEPTNLDELREMIGREHPNA